MNGSRKRNRGNGQSSSRRRGAGKDAHGYMPGLDGLRALAVFAVIAYHLNLSWVPGGLLGVSLFFVLSGYLITNILLRQWEQTGKIDLKDFWLRRARRLLPALFLVLAGVMLWVMIGAPERLAALKQEVLAALFYTSNWYLIFHQVSYFESFGPPSPLGHLWSLAVEEQFYLFWPLLLGWGLRCFKQRKFLVWGTIAITLASAAAMALIYTPGLDPSRVYYGTDTRAFAMLVGAALALIWPSRKMTGDLSRNIPDNIPDNISNDMSNTMPIDISGHIPENISGDLTPNLSAKKRLALDGIGILALLVVLVMIGKTNQYQPFLYQGGLLLFSVAAACLVAVLAHPASRLGRVFSWRPLRWLGECSYGIYLWHYPVIILTNPIVNTEGLNLPRTLGQIALSVTLAALSRYLVEDPIRYGRWKTARRRKRGLQWWQRPLAHWGKITAGMVVLFLLAFVTSNEGLQFSAKALTESHEETAQVQGQPAPPAQGTKSEEGTAAQGESAGADQQSEGKGKGIAGDKIAGNKAAENKDVENKVTGNDITIIGDSVMINVTPVLQERLPGIVVDAQLGRQMLQAQAVIEGLRKEGKLGKIVVLELGTNGPFSEKQLREILDSLSGSSEILLINTRVPKPWETEVNETLKKVAENYPRIRLIDWHVASSGHKEYLYADGVHLNQSGVEAYGKMLTEALLPHQNDQPKSCYNNKKN